MNPVGYFEIPVQDFERAVGFYSTVFGYTFIMGNVDNLEMAFFPFDSSKGGITGALVQGDVYKPTIEGVIIYFNTHSIDAILNKVLQHGGEILYPKTSVGEYGFVAEFKDCEGNRIALTEK